MIWTFSLPNYRSSMAIRIGGRIHPHGLSTKRCTVTTTLMKPSVHTPIDINETGGNPVGMRITSRSCSMIWSGWGWNPICGRSSVPVRKLTWDLTPSTNISTERQTPRHQRTPISSNSQQRVEAATGRGWRDLINHQDEHGPTGRIRLRIELRIRL